MHFTCSRVELTKAVDVVQHAIAKVQNTIQDCILFECREDHVTLKATDRTLAMSTILQTTVQNPGVAAIPARLLGDILRKLPDMDLTLETLSGSTARLQCGPSRIDLQLQNPDEFPVFPVVNAEGSVFLPQAQLRRMIDQVIFAVATNEDKPILTGVLFELNGNRLTLAAIDGFRMAVREEDVMGEAKGSFVAPARAIREAARAMTDNEMDVRIEFDRSRVRFEVGSTQILTQLLEGEYVSYRNLFPKSFAIQMQIDRVMLLQTIERAIVMTDNSDNSVTKLHLQENTLIVEAESMRGKMREIIPVITQGDDLHIAINGRFLMDVLKSIEDEEITLLFNTSTSPCAAEKKGIQSYGYLILPIQVG